MLFTRQEKRKWSTGHATRCRSRWVCTSGMGWTMDGERGGQGQFFWKNPFIFLWLLCLYSLGPPTFFCFFILGPRNHIFWLRLWFKPLHHTCLIKLRLLERLGSYWMFWDVIEWVLSLGVVYPILFSFCPTVHIISFKIKTKISTILRPLPPSVDLGSVLFCKNQLKFNYMIYLQFAKPNLPCETARLGRI